MCDQNLLFHSVSMHLHIYFQFVRSNSAQKLLHPASLGMRVDRKRTALTHEHHFLQHLHFPLRGLILGLIDPVQLAKSQKLAA